MANTARRLFLIGALNKRGIKGPPVTWLLRHFSHDRIARQIDYYDFDMAPLLDMGIPAWAAWPWLLSRIRCNRPATEGFAANLGGTLDSLRAIAESPGLRTQRRSVDGI